MARTNYSFEKRQRDLAKKRKKEEKRKRKAERKTDGSEEPVSAEGTPPDGAETGSGPTVPAESE